MAQQFKETAFIRVSIRTWNFIGHCSKQSNKNWPVALKPWV